MWTYLLCRLPVAQNHNFGHILTFGVLPYRSPFTDKGQIWCATTEPRSTVACRISSECVHCLGFWWPKTTIFNRCWHFGAPVPTPFYRWESNLVCYSKPAVYAYLLNFVSIGLFCRLLLAKNPNFYRFWTSAFSDVVNWQQSEKVGHGCTTTNLPLSSGIKIVLILCWNTGISCWK